MQMQSVNMTINKIFLNVDCPNQIGIIIIIIIKANGYYFCHSNGYSSQSMTLIWTLKLIKRPFEDKT